MLTIPARLENYTRLQPMRSFHLIYVVFFLLLGGLIGEFVLLDEGGGDGRIPGEWAGERRFDQDSHARAL